MSKLTDLLKFEAEEIEHFFRKASIEGAGTPQEVSDRREPAVAKFLKRYFPFPHQIAKGNIIDSYGNRSQSIDCIILSPSHPNTIDGAGNFSLILADGVDAAIEVKPDLSSVTEIHRMLEQAKSVKSLKRKRFGTTNQGAGSPQMRETLHTIPFYVFSTKTYKNRKHLAEKIVDYYCENKIGRQLQFDFLIVSNRMVIFNSGKFSYFDHDLARGLYFFESEEDIISTFLLLLISTPKSEMSIGPNVLAPYLEWKFKSLETYPDLNTRLVELDASKNSMV